MDSVYWQLDNIKVLSENYNFEELFLLSDLDSFLTYIL